VSNKKYLIFPDKLLSLPLDFPVMIVLRWTAVKLSGRLMDNRVHHGDYT